MSEIQIFYTFSFYNQKLTLFLKKFFHLYFWKLFKEKWKKCGFNPFSGIFRSSKALHCKLRYRPRFVKISALCDEYKGEVVSTPNTGGGNYPQHKGEVVSTPNTRGEVVTTPNTRGRW